MLNRCSKDRCGYVRKIEERFFYFVRFDLIVCVICNTCAYRYEIVQHSVAVCCSCCFFSLSSSALGVELTGSWDRTNCHYVWLTLCTGTGWAGAEKSQRVRKRRSPVYIRTCLPAKATYVVSRYQSRGRKQFWK